MTDRMKASGIVLLTILLCVSVFPHSINGEITAVYWRSYVEVEHFIPVRIVDSRNRPPSDAYDTSKHHDCRTVTTYDASTKTTRTRRECHWEYSWTMDRWVVKYVSTNESIDRNPTYNIPELVHVETGYGNERYGKQYIHYFISADFGKTCNVSEKLWLRSNVGDEITTTRLGFIYTLCRIRQKDDD